MYESVEPTTIYIAHIVDRVVGSTFPSKSVFSNGVKLSFPNKSCRELMVNGMP